MNNCVDLTTDDRVSGANSATDADEVQIVETLVAKRRATSQKRTESSSTSRKRRRKGNKSNEVIEIDDSVTTIAPPGKHGEDTEIIDIENNRVSSGRFSIDGIALIDKPLETSNHSSKASDPVKECQCCYADVSTRQMSSCRKGHYFCNECINRYAEEEVFGKSKSDLKCFFSGSTSSCDSEFHISQLDKSLKPSTMKKYNEAKFQQNLQKANIDNLGKCPKCHFQAILGKNADTFNCLKCKFNSCLECGEEAHFPLACREIENKQDTDVRKTIEEAMTKARIRECPKCRNKFFKTDGCNKMKCSCGALICYVCRQIIKDYTHFCRKPHCRHKNCGNCPLHTNTVEDDKMAVKEAGLEQFKDLSHADPNSASKVNINKLFKDLK